MILVPRIVFTQFQGHLKDLRVSLVIRAAAAAADR